MIFRSGFKGLLECPPVLWHVQTDRLICNSKPRGSKRTGKPEHDLSSPSTLYLTRNINWPANPARFTTYAVESLAQAAVIATGLLVAGPERHHCVRDLTAVMLHGSGCEQYLIRESRGMKYPVPVVSYSSAANRHSCLLCRD